MRPHPRLFFGDRSVYGPLLGCGLGADWGDRAQLIHSVGTGLTCLFLGRRAAFCCHFSWACGSRDRAPFFGVKQRAQEDERGNPGRAPGLRQPPHLGVALVVVLLRADPAAHQVVAHGMRQGEEVVAGRGHVAVLDQRKVQVPVEALPHLGHVAQSRDPAHTDLLPFLTVR